MNMWYKDNKIMYLYETEVSSNLNSEMFLVSKTNKS